MNEYKLVILPDGSEHQVPEEHQWMAMDSDGEWCTFRGKPVAFGDEWFDGYINFARIETMNGPFEEGDWTEQLYWIGE